MFRSVFSKNLKNPRTRQTAIQQAVDSARQAYSKGPPETAREPILKLQDQFDQEGLDRLELLYAAESALTSDQFWLREIVDILTRRDTLNISETSYFLRLAILHPERLELWRRVFKERRPDDDQEAFIQAREKCALALLPFFSDDSDKLWDDGLSESEAINLLSRSLADAVQDVIAKGRQDAEAFTLCAAALRYFPSDQEARSYLARLIVGRDEEPTQANIQLVLEALLENPDDLRMKLWSGKALLRSPRHFDEGMSILRQLHHDDPSNEELEREYVTGLKMSDHFQPGDIEFLRGFLSRNPGDLRVLEIVADDHASRQDLSPEALKLYRTAAAQSVKRRRYLRLLGRDSAEKKNWSEVIQLFDEIREAGEETDEILLPLATAYAEFHKDDGEAMEVYRKAIAAGSRRIEVHSIYCRHLYTTKRSAPESIKQYMQSTEVCPECSWAQLGLGAHYLETLDYGRALDSAIQLLTRAPKDTEAIRLGAKALAKDFSRRMLARLGQVAPAILRPLFEEAHRLAPDAGPITMGLVRRRLADGVRDEDTVRLIGEVCRKNPEVVDLRVARADLLWDLGQKANSMGLYRELADRWLSGTGSQLPRGITPDVRRRVILRLTEQLLQPPGATVDDVEILMEAAGESGIPEEMIVAIARAMISLDVDHPQKLGLVERAAKLARGDLKILRARAELMAAKGNPRPAIELSIRLIDEGQTGEESANLLRSVAAVASKGSIEQESLKKLIRELDPEVHPPTLLMAAIELMSVAGPPSRLELPLLAKLREVFPRNVRIQHRLAQCHAASGDHETAADMYDSLVHNGKLDDELVVELAKTNLRLGRHSREQYKVAQRAALLEPNNIELQFHLACIELEMGKLSEAARLFDKVLEMDASFHPRVYSALEHNREIRTEHGGLFLIMARVHLKAGRIEQALRVLSELQIEYQRYLGDLVSIYEDVIKIAPDNPRPYVERAILYRLSGHLEEAVTDLQRAHAVAPDNTDLLVELADAQRQMVVAASKLDVDVALECAEHFLHLGDDRQSYEMVELIIEEEKDNERALLLLARLQLNALALQNCWRTIKRVGNREKTLRLMQELARAFAEHADPVLAADVLTEAIEVAGPQRELLEQLRSLYQEQAVKDEKRHAHQRVLGALSQKVQSRYELREELGSGSMGVVYKAYDRELDDIVCLKILPEKIANDPNALARFRNEAKAARRLAHPNICRIHDIGAEDDRRHISMEYVGGGNLRNYLTAQGGRLPEDESIRIVREIAEALVHAHGEGVLHRDIKAANIMLTTAGKVKLSDFGIAALAEAATSDLVSQTSSVVIGTPLYMSPEQFDGHSLTPASDLYSLGVLFYEMLSGRPPFTRGSIPYHHRFTLPAPIANVSEHVWTIVRKLLTKDPRSRHQSATELIQELDALKTGSPRLDDTQ